MNRSDITLWNSIKAFRFDEDEVTFTFGERLARENQWTADFAKRAIEEYRKFLFLCCVSAQQITPSDVIDQVWHLHLTYTRSYWKRLCGEVLRKELHHNPTKGGREERDKFDSCYTRTFSLYENYFGSRPPAEMWPENNLRFAKTDHARVDRLKYWLIRRPALNWRIAATIALITIAAMVNIAATAKNWTEHAVMGVFLIAIIIGIFRGRRNKDRKESGNCSGGCSVLGCAFDSDTHGCSDGGCGSGCGGD
jgi:hypothetical protein